MFVGLVYFFFELVRWKYFDRICIWLGFFIIFEMFSGEMSVEVMDKMKIFVIGVGGLGCEFFKNFVFLGFKNIYVIDMDIIDIFNFNC